MVLKLLEFWKFWLPPNLIAVSKSIDQRGLKTGNVNQMDTKARG